MLYCVSYVKLYQALSLLHPFLILSSFFPPSQSTHMHTQTTHIDKHTHIDETYINFKGGISNNHPNNAAHVCYHLWYAGCNEADLTDDNGTVNTGRCAGRGFVNSLTISDGVVCYNGTTAGSMAIYICNDGFALVGGEPRVCQSDGMWNGSIPQCIPEDSGTYCSHLYPCTLE